MDLRDFSRAHGGLNLIVRRHLQSRKADLHGLASKPGALSLRLGHALDDRLQGLSAKGTKNAFEQGRALAQDLVIWPNAIVCGLDQRNIDGALATAEGITWFAETPALQGRLKVPPVLRSPGITYPYYGDLKRVAELFRQYWEPDDNRACLMHISGRFSETAGFWTEPVEAVAKRLLAAVEAPRHGRSPWGLELWDVNYEQMVILHQLLVVGQTLSELLIEPVPLEPDGYRMPYNPEYGAGFVVGADNIVTEFTPTFEIGSSAKG